MKWPHVSLLIFALSWPGLAAVAAPLEVGGTVPPLSVQDQWGHPLVVTNGLRHLLIAVEMAPAKAANRDLGRCGAGFLEQHHAAYCLDIHTMPGIARLFAFPKLRRYPHHIGLVDDAAALQWVPTQPGRITVLDLNESRRITAVRYWDPVTATSPPW